MGATLHLRGVESSHSKPPQVAGNYAIFTFRFLLAVKSVQEAVNSLVFSYEVLSAKIMVQR